MQKKLINKKVITRKKMSKFGDLINGKNISKPVVEAPPVSVLEEVSAPVVEKEVVTSVDLSSMSKNELEDYGRKLCQMQQ